MTFVVSQGSVKALERPALPASTSLRLTDDYTQDYAEIWRTQPAVRTVVSFLARNIASLGIHVFERVSETDRKRLRDNPVTTVIEKPNPRTTRYRLINSLVHDLGIYDVGYWLKLKDPGLFRLPPRMTKPVGDNWMWAEQFEVKGGRGKVKYDADQVVHFHGFNPDDPRTGCSPIESLRRVLAEEYEAGRMREQILRNGARVSGYLERPKDAPKWTDPAREKFRTQWRGQYSGNGPAAGGTPILEDGMTFNAASQTADELQYIQARKLTREEVASAYFIPPPMVGILDHATFGNIEEQHKMLYQDTLGPWLSMLEQEIQLQLVPDLIDNFANVYVEFNLAEKLKGSFEDQASSLQTMTGRPIMTADEGRARLNLPALGGDAAQLVTPLNVLIGGQASPTDSAPKAIAAGRIRFKARAPETHETKHVEVLRAFFKRQAAAVKSNLGAGTDDWWDGDRWDKELSEDLWKLGIQASEAVAAKVLESLALDPEEYDSDLTLAFLASLASRIGESVNAVTKLQLDDALDAEDPTEAVAGVFDQADSKRAPQIAVTAVTAVSGFATTEAAKQVAGDAAEKTWVAGSNPRASHAAMSGETVGLDEAFSNGAMWPADAALDVDEVAGCNCELEISIP